MTDEEAIRVITVRAKLDPVGTRWKTEQCEAVYHHDADGFSWNCTRERYHDGPHASISSRASHRLYMVWIDGQQ